VVQYALIDSALRSAEHFSIAAQCAEIDDLWSRLSAVSADNARAAFPGFRSSEQLRSPLDGNRPLAFPYRKWHSTQWTVDQAAALLLCAEDSAHRFGLDPTRLIHPHVALESSFALSLSRRAEMHRWPAMELLGEVAAQHLDRPLDDIELVELYSCFPAAVRVQQRELRLPLAGTPTVTGSMSFAGGPFNHATFQSTATMVEKLRAAPGALGLVTTVSGLLTKPGLMVWGTTAPPRGLLVADLAEHAAARTAVAEVADTVEASGPITVAACTATYDAAGPLDLIVIGDSAAGRVVARFADPDLAARAETEELIGTVIDAS
jgi:acetyl-CoA C-acetyltransferase